MKTGTLLSSRSFGRSIVALLFLAVLSSACSTSSPPAVLSPSDTPAKVLATTSVLMQKASSAHFETQASMNDGITTISETVNGDDLLPDQTVSNYSVSTIDNTGVTPPEKSSYVILENKTRFFQNIENQWYFVKKSNVKLEQMVALPRLNLLDIQKMLHVARKATLTDGGTKTDAQGSSVRQITATFLPAQFLSLIQSDGQLVSFFNYSSLSFSKNVPNHYNFTSSLNLWIDQATGYVNKIQFNFHVQLTPKPSPSNTLDNSVNATISNVDQPVTIAPPTNASPLKAH